MKGTVNSRDDGELLRTESAPGEGVTVYNTDSMRMPVHLAYLLNSNTSLLEENPDIKIIAQNYLDAQFKSYTYSTAIATMNEGVHTPTLYNKQNITWPYYWPDGTYPNYGGVQNYTGAGMCGLWYAKNLTAPSYDPRPILNSIQFSNDDDKSWGNDAYNNSFTLWGLTSLASKSDEIPGITVSNTVKTMLDIVNSIE